MKPDREFSARFLRFHMTAISRKIGIFVSVMEKIRFVALIFCLSFLYAICDAQELTPVVSQFDKEDYMAANQNWAVSQDADGIMYFGNGEGLLAFDGILWTLYNLPHNKIARSVMADGDRIYVGSYEEFGFFRKCHNGTLEYESLSSALTGYEMQNDEIWTILKYGDKVVFQAFASYFVYDGKEVFAVKSPSVFMFFSEFSDKIYTDTNDLGLAEVDILTGKISQVSVPFSSPMIAVLPKNQKEAYVVTYSDGIYLFDGENFTPFRTDADRFLKNSQVNKAVLSEDGTLVIGTLLSGAVAIDACGRKLWGINSTNVLQSNTVLGLKYDMDGNLWLALDTGIAVVPGGLPVMYASSLKPSVGSVYDVYFDGDGLYLATGQGLYRSDFSPLSGHVGDTEMIPEVHGHVWYIDTFDGQVFCGTNKSTYEISDRGVVEVCGVEGGMCMSRGRIGDQDVLVQGTYTYLCVYVRRDGKWVYSHHVEDFMEPISSLEIDGSGIVWAGHMHQGLYRIRLSDDLETVSSMKYYPSLSGTESLPVHVCSVTGNVVFNDCSSFYIFDRMSGDILPYDRLNSALGHFCQAYRVCSSGYSSSWFITSSEAAKVVFKGDSIAIADVVPYRLLDSHTVDMYQNIVPLLPGKDMFTLENSVAVYNSDSLGSYTGLNKAFIGSMKISDMKMQSDSLLSLSADRHRIPFRYRNVSFTVKCPKYNPVNDIKFSYFLEGRDFRWSDPSPSPEISYMWLPAGKYVFHVKVTTSTGTECRELTRAFRITPPVWLSLPALMLYLIVLMTAVYFVVTYVRGRFIQQELEFEINDKSKELSSATMSLIRKNSVLMQLKEELDKQKHALGSSYPDIYYNRLSGIISRHLGSDEDWQIFYQNFDRIHEHFFRNLHSSYPDLTSNDLKVCAYLRLNLSSKDISSLMNISLKGVEAARSRLRKKFGLPSDVNLVTFLIDFK